MYECVFVTFLCERSLVILGCKIRCVCVERQIIIIIILTIKEQTRGTSIETVMNKMVQLL